jgi:hypothetical protein
MQKASCEMKKFLHKWWSGDRRGWVIYSTSGGLLGFAILAAILFAVLHEHGTLSAEGLLMVSDTPHAMPPLVQPLFACDSPQACLVDSILSKAALFPTTGSGLCHLLRVHGLGAISHDRFSSGQEVVQALTDATVSQKCLGQSLAFETRYGVRFRFSTASDTGGENHQDLVLATFAELGLPLSTPLRTETGSFEIRDVLRDSIAHFTLQQEEIAWTAIAYALYLPPQKAWCNRDGERFTFGHLADELVRPDREEPCGGTHLLYAMTLLVRVDSASPCLSTATREAVLRHLRQRVSTAVASQANEGYWTFGWDGGGLVSDTLEDRLLITAHLVEWMEQLPTELQPSPDVYRRAARWLCAEVSDASLTEPADFCPWTHAVRSIQNLIDKVDGTGAPIQTIITGR